MLHFSGLYTLRFSLDRLPAFLLCGIAGATYAYVRRSRKQTDAIEKMEEEALAAADED